MPDGWCVCCHNYSPSQISIKFYHGHQPACIKCNCNSCANKSVQTTRQARRGNFALFPGVQCPPRKCDNQDSCAKLSQRVASVAQATRSLWHPAVFLRWKQNVIQSIEERQPRCSNSLCFALAPTGTRDYGAWSREIIDEPPRRIFMRHAATPNSTLNMSGGFSP